jgi:hypothetical protein
MSQLEPCPHCHRHVVITETACPFCARPLDLSAVAPRSMPRARLGRAAIFAFGIAATTAACETDTKKIQAPQPDAAVGYDANPNVHPDASFDDDAGVVAIYSAAPTQPRG